MNLVPILPCLLCVVVDYMGLGVLLPVLPFYLRDSGNMTMSELELWTGLISSSQFVAVMAACLVMGVVSDRIGAKRTMQLVMIGNTIIFSINAFVHTPGVLLAIRVCIGFCSPLVPALVYIFEVVPSEHTVFGTSAFMFAVVLGILLGGATVGLYDDLGWMGISLFMGGLSCIGLLSTIPRLTNVTTERCVAVQDAQDARPA